MCLVNELYTSFHILQLLIQEPIFFLPNFMSSLALSLSKTH